MDISINKSMNHLINKLMISYDKNSELSFVAEQIKCVLRHGDVHCSSLEPVLS